MQSKQKYGIHLSLKVDARDNYITCEHDERLSYREAIAIWKDGHKRNILSP